MKNYASLVITLLVLSGCASTGMLRRHSPPLTATLARSDKLVTTPNIVLKLTLTNESKAPVNLPYRGFVEQFITSEIRMPDGKVVRKRHSGGALGHGKYPGGDIVPDDSLTVSLNHVVTSEGTYLIKCVLDTRPDSCPWLTANGKHPYIWPLWQGRIESNTIKLEVKKTDG